MDETPKDKAEIWRKLDSQLLPLLRETVEGSIAPETMAYEYDKDRWETLMEWLKKRACIDLLRFLKQAEPPKTDVEKHEVWQHHYDKFYERALGFVKMKDAGVFNDPEAAYFVIQLMLKVNDFSGRALEYLSVRPKGLGMAERPDEIDVVLKEADGG